MLFSSLLGLCLPRGTETCKHSATQRLPQGTPESTLLLTSIRLWDVFFLFGTPLKGFIQLSLTVSLSLTQRCFWTGRLLPTINEGQEIKTDFSLMQNNWGAGRKIRTASFPRSAMTQEQHSGLNRCPLAPPARVQPDGPQPVLCQQPVCTRSVGPLRGNTRFAF